MKHGVVAAGHEITAEVAAEVLRGGGNAFDAAIAGFFTACVVEPVLASIGGGGFLIAQMDRKSKVFDFFTQTPMAKDLDNPLDFYPVTVDFGSTQQNFHVGLGSCATPGCVRGIFDIHKQLGSVPLTELIAPAIRYAREGFRLNALQAYILSIVAPIYQTESSRPLFSGTQEGKLAAHGDTLVFSELADTMEVLAIEGETLFYEGEIAHWMVQSSRERGGYLDYADLKNYRTYERDPLPIDYHGHRLFINPPPSSGGLLIGFGLGLLDGCDRSMLNYGTYDHLRALTEVMLATTKARLDHFSHGPDPGFLDQDLLRRYRHTVRQRVHTARGTTHISVIDAKHNVAAMTVSNGEGCGYITPGAGFMLNNMLGEEDLSPAGFHDWKNNQRMSSMMAPGILQTTDALMALGSGGSNRIRTAILQVVSNLVDFSMDLETAVQSPRLHIESDVLNVEAGFDQVVLDSLITEFPEHRLFDHINMFFGGCHVACMNANNHFQAMGDPRRGGVGIVVD